jgi:glycosyltransferase 2 family protein
VKYVKVYVKMSIMFSLIAYLYLKGYIDFRVFIREGITIKTILCHIAGLLLLFCSMCLQVYRWVIVLDSQQCNLSYVAAAKISWFAGAYALVMPGSLGADALRALSLYRCSNDKKLSSISTIFTERFIGLIALLWLAGLASICIFILHIFKSSQQIAQQTLIGSYFFALLNIVILIYLVLPRSYLQRILLPIQRFAKVHDVIFCQICNKRILLQCFVISIFATFFDTVSYYFAAIALGVFPDFFFTILYGPVITLANMLPVSPGGIGVAEAMAAFLFNREGIMIGAMIMMVTRLWVLILRLPGFTIEGMSRQRSF